MNGTASIIVPVYNACEYIALCVGSLVNQTYRNLEIILVDDASTDGSGALCDSLAASDGRIKVLHMSRNGGVSKARNAGLDIMTGDYVTFVDGDDFVGEHFIERLVAALEETNADVATCGHIRINLDSSERPLYSARPGSVRILSGQETLENMFYGRVCSASSGSKLYRRRLFDSLRFPEDFVMGEDTYVVYYAFSASKTVAHTSMPMYYYVQHPTSVTNARHSYFKFYDYVRLYDHIVASYSFDDNKALYSALINRLIENNFWVYMKLRRCKGMYFHEKRHIERNIKKYRACVIKNPRADKRVRAACLVSLGGAKALNAVYDAVSRLTE